MKKRILIVLLLTLTLCGCKKNIPKLNNGEEAVVSFKNGTLISINELYNEMKDRYATSILIDMIDTKILEDKYKDKLDEADNYVDNQIKSVKSYYTDENGKYNESNLLKDLNSYYGINSIEEYEKMLKLNYLRNKAIEDYSKSKVTDSEINKYYKNEIVGDREVSHILIVPEVKDNMTDDEKTKEEEKALATAKEVIAKLKKGEKFEDLAKEYSNDEATKENGGSLGFINKGYNGSEEFDKEVYSLKIDTFSNTPVKTTSGYEIIYVKSEKEKASLEDVKNDIIEKISANNLSNDSTIQVNGLKSTREEYGVNIEDDDIKTTYNKYMNNLLDQALQK